MKVFVICLVLAIAVSAYAVTQKPRPSGGGRIDGGEPGFHHAGRESHGGGAHHNIGGNEGTLHTGSGGRIGGGQPGYHEAGKDAHGGGPHHNIGGTH